MSNMPGKLAEENRAEKAEEDHGLEAALTRLASPDREILILRFYQESSFAEMGVALGISEEAARKRTGRALAKLKRMLRHRGTLAAALVGLMTIRRAVALPGMTERIAGQVAGRMGVSGSSMDIAKGVMSMLRQQRIKLAVAAATVVALSVAVGGIWIYEGIATAPQSAPQFAAAPAEETPVTTAPAEVSPWKQASEKAVAAGDTTQPSGVMRVFLINLKESKSDDAGHLYEDQGVTGPSISAPSLVVVSGMVAGKGAVNLGGPQLNAGTLDIGPGALSQVQVVAVGDVGNGNLQVAPNGTPIIETREMTMTGVDGKVMNVKVTNSPDGGTVTVNGDPLPVQGVVRPSETP